jgi:hypothetical protein
MLRLSLVGMVLAAACGCAHSQVSSRPPASVPAPPLSQPPNTSASELDCVPDHEPTDMEFTANMPECPISRSAWPQHPSADHPSSRAYSNSSPTPYDVAGAMRSVFDRVRDCGEGHGGTVAVTMVFSRRGRVERVSVLGRRASTPVGTCVVEALRSAQLPPFERAEFSVMFPFRLR